MNINREIWEQLRAAYTAVSKAADDLPHLPADGVCVCGSNNWRFIEIGYTMDRLMVFDDGWAAISDGWDDVSEDGRATPWVYCYDCDLEYRVPDRMDWQ